MTVALVPMKDLPNAKQRLSSVLSKEERIGLVNAMLGDVLAALAKAETIDAVNIIAHDQNFSEFNVGFIQEAKNAGYNEAVGFALECAEIADASAGLVLPGDIPLVRASEINALAAKTKEPTVRIAGARDGDGTNGLLISPPRQMNTHFGIGSFARHQKIARNTGAHLETIKGEGISFDIDTPDDLIAYCAVDALSETHTFLDLSGIRRRLLEENSKTMAKNGED